MTQKNVSKINGLGYLVLVDLVDSTNIILKNNLFKPGEHAQTILGYFMDCARKAAPSTPRKIQLIIYTGDGAMFFIPEKSSEALISLIRYLDTTPFTIKSIIFKSRIIIHHHYFELTFFNNSICNIFPSADGLILFKLEKFCPTDCILLTGRAYQELKPDIESIGYTPFDKEIPKEWKVIKDYIASNIFIIPRKRNQGRRIHAHLQKFRPIGEELRSLLLPMFNWDDKEKDELIHTTFISTLKTADALSQLIRHPRAKSIKAICGLKGSFSKAYYADNFEIFSEVYRIFSYDAILFEFNKKADFSLKGLGAHIKKAKERAKAKDNRRINIFLLPKGYKLQTDSGQKLPESFGMAMVLDSKKKPIQCVLHWERIASKTSPFINIEGFVINETQPKILSKLLYYYDQLITKDEILKWQLDEEKIISDYNSLKHRWQSLQSTNR